MNKYENKERSSVIEDKELEQVSGGLLISPTPVSAPTQDEKTVITADSPDTNPPTNTAKPRFI